jgi:hypothetical protein
VRTAARSRPSALHRATNVIPQLAHKLRAEYDLSELKGQVRGKYLQRYRSGTNLVLLSPDVAEHFPNSQAVNSALRTLIRRSKNI